MCVAGCTLASSGAVMGTLKVAVITTPTLHHNWFLDRLQDAVIRRICDISLVFVLVEMRPFPWRKRFWQYARKHYKNPLKATLLNPYLHIPYKEEAMATFEERNFPTVNARCGAPHFFVEAANTPGQDVMDLLREVDLALSYGPGLLKPEIFSAPRLGTINAHGGILPWYRGLDTNLWAAYRKEPWLMGVTLHKVNEGLDTGPIYLYRWLEPTPDLSCITLRYYTTLLATEMFIGLLTRLTEGEVPTYPEGKFNVGKYYPPMPFLYKPVADRRLRKWATI